MPAIWSSPDTCFNSYFGVIFNFSGHWGYMSLPVTNDKNWIKSLLTLLQIESRISLSLNVSIGTLGLGGRAGDLIVGWSFDCSLLCMCNICESDVCHHFHTHTLIAASYPNSEYICGKLLILAWQIRWPLSFTWTWDSFLSFFFNIKFIRSLFYQVSLCLSYGI